MKKMLTYLKNKFIWQRIPAKTLHFKALENEIVFLVGYAIVYIILGYLLGLLILYFPIPILGATQFNQDFWYSIVFKIVLLLLIPTFIYFKLWKYKIGDLFLGSRLNIFSAVITITLGFLLNSSHLIKIQESISNFPDAPIRLTLGIMMPLLTAAIPEELFFRGYLQTRLENKWNRLVAILVSSILFTAWHLPSRYLLSKGVEGQAGDWAQVLLYTGLPVFIISILIGIHWSRYRNIIILILFHWSVDVLPAVSSYFKIPF